MTRSDAHRRYAAMIAVIDRAYGPALEPIGPPARRPRGDAVATDSLRFASSRPTSLAKCK
jgi:hypothetical protein